MCRRLLLFSLILCSFNGCTMFQWLAPHQLWKLNRQPAMGGEDAYFSIPADAGQNARQMEVPSPSLQ